jgi:trk system potassium uptake protein TrkA
VAQVHSLRRGAAEALEIVAHGDKKNSTSSAAASANCRRFTAPSSPPSCATSAKLNDFNFFHLGEKKQIGQVLIAHKDVVIETVTT